MQDESKVIWEAVTRYCRLDQVEAIRAYVLAWSPAEPGPADAQSNLVERIEHAIWACGGCSGGSARKYAEAALAVAHAHPPAGLVTVEERDAQWEKEIEKLWQDWGDAIWSGKTFIDNLRARLTAPPKPTIPYPKAVWESSKGWHVYNKDKRLVGVTKSDELAALSVAGLRAELEAHDAD